MSCGGPGPPVNGAVASFEKLSPIIDVVELRIALNHKRRRAMPE
jgi:hypothetical protein